IAFLPLDDVKMLGVLTYERVTCTCTWREVLADRAYPVIVETSPETDFVAYTWQPPMLGSFPALPSFEMVPIVPSLSSSENLYTSRKASVATPSAAAWVCWASRRMGAA